MELVFAFLTAILSIVLVFIVEGKCHAHGRNVCHLKRFALVLVLFVVLAFNARILFSDHPNAIAALSTTVVTLLVDGLLTVKR